MAAKSSIRTPLLPYTIFMVVFGLLFLAPAIAAASSQASVATHSPSAEVELICHTDNPAECYPKIFQPTEEFQIVHEDQDLPPGLHVRMNINTGEKEAKINDPTEQIAELEGKPTDRSIVVVDPENSAEEEQPLPKGAPKYDPVGMVKPPQQESGQFYTNLDFVRKGANGADLPLDEVLEFLEDISHDIYYGVKITETFDTVKALFCLMTDPKTPAPGEGAVPRDQQAAAIISGALQNNPTALEEVTKIWPALMDAKCSITEVKDAPTLRDSFYASFVPSNEDGATVSTADGDVLRAANKAKAQIAAIRGLLKSPTIRDDFIANNGMDRLLEILAPEDARWDSTQRKAGQLVLDSFLDEAMGAEVGVWPLFKASEADASKRVANRVSDGNWLTAVKKIMQRNKGDKSHWSKDLFDRLEAHEGAQLKKLGKQEL